jgi:hypothetical protein
LRDVLRQKKITHGSKRGVPSFWGTANKPEKKEKKEDNFAKSKVETKIAIYFIITLLNTKLL